MLCQGVRVPLPLLCAAPRQAVLLCALHTGNSRAATHYHVPLCHALSRSTQRHQHWQGRWCWWRQQQQQEHSLVTSRHQTVLAGGIRRVAAYSTSTGTPPASQSTAEEGQEEEVDLEALVELELELYRQEGFPLPSEITEVQWKDLLSYKTVKSRKKYLTFLFKNEKKAEKLRRKKEEKRIQVEERERQRRENLPEGNGHIEYGLWRNSIFLKVLDSTMHHSQHCRVIQSMMFGQPLVLDMSYDAHMTIKERQNCAYQIQMMLSENRRHDDPFALELHNAAPTQDTMLRLERYIPIMYKPEFPLVVNPGSYLDKYPKEQLVYLTPHCREEMRSYDHDAVYIVGAIVDKSSGDPLSLAKAKKEGIHMQKLPLERYLSWGIGGKSLTLNQIIGIMLDIKTTGDWWHALRHVPRRKLKLPPTQEELEAEMLKRIRQNRRKYHKTH